MRGRRRRRATGSLVHDETPRRSVARVRARRGWPSTPRRRRRSACSARSSGRRTRSRCSGSSSRAAERSGPGDLAALLRSGADLDGQLAPTRRRAARSVERAEHHAGARLGREERRLLRHARAVDAPRRGSARPRPGCRGSPRVAAPLSTRAATRAGVVPVAPRRVGEAGHDERLDDRGVGRGDRGVLVGERGGARRRGAGPRARGRGRRRGRARARRASRSLERVDAVGRVRARVDDRRTRRRAGRGGRRRRAGRAGGGSARCRARRRRARRRTS